MLIKIDAKPLIGSRGTFPTGRQGLPWASRTLLSDGKHGQRLHEASQNFKSSPSTTLSLQMPDSQVPSRKLLDLFMQA